MRTYFPTVTEIRFVRVTSGGRVHAQSEVLWLRSRREMICVTRLDGSRLSEHAVDCASCSPFAAQPNAVDVTDEHVVEAIA